MYAPKKRLIIHTLRSLMRAIKHHAPLLPAEKEELRIFLDALQPYEKELGVTVVLTERIKE